MGYAALSKNNRILIPFVFLLFFLSGACGLSYQVIWVRMFEQIFGNTLYSVSTVLTAFMAGLALGSYLSGKYWSQRIDSLRLFAGAETVIGMAGFLMPLAILLLSAVYSWLYRSFAPSFELLTAVRFLLSVIVLAVPCTMMGATLPFITNWAVNRLGATERVCGIVYGINTAGAVFGCVLAGFFLIREFGVARTCFLTAGVNGVVGLASLLLARIQKRAIKKEKIVSRDAMQEVGASDIPENRPGLAAVLMAAYALSGFSALALEIAWTKALGRMFLFAWSYQMDSYAFAAILAVILFGIGAGSCAATFAFRKTRRYGTPLVCVQWLLGLSVLGSIAVLQHPIVIRDWLFFIVNAPAFRWLWGPLVSFAGSQIVMQVLMATVLLGVPALLMGMAFPLFTLWYNQVKKNIGMSIGTIYSSNTIGAIFGSVLTGFFLVPAIGLLPTIALLAGIYCLTALALQYIGTRSWKRTGAAAFVLLGIPAAAVCLTDLNYSHVLKKVIAGNDSPGTTMSIDYFRESASGGILVRKNESGGFELYNDGTIVAASAGPNLYSHLFPAHLISLLAKEQREILVIGFGCGLTSGSLLLYNEVTGLDGVEISKGILGPAKTYFNAASNNVFADPRLHFIVQDGKNYVRMTDKKYDVIYASPSFPQANQVSAGLFTREFFSDCKKRLKPAGFQCLWIPLHMYRPEEFLTIIKTFQSVYPHVSLWHPYQNEMSIGLAYCIGSDGMLDPDYQKITEKLKRPAIRQDIMRLGDGAFQTPEEFISIFSMGERSLKSVTDVIKVVNSDDYPVVELYKRTGDMMQAAITCKLQLVELLGKNSENPFSYVRNVQKKENDTVKNILSRMYAGKQFLIMGHAMAAYKEFLSASGNCPPEIDGKMRQYYSLAYGYIPENLFLRAIRARGK